ncbi:hypothetical protein HDU93_007738 [Gonapodya sp. JEL0774]|nr:hypothetical protein HDU93_007738 [Gonapodya sp. JEL0774]
MSVFLSTDLLSSLPVPEPYTAAIVAVVLLATGVTISAIAQHRARAQRLEFEVKHRDRIILWQFKRPTTAPSGSPFCTKGETILRFLGAKYDNAWCLNDKFDRKKVPVYEYNGKVYQDSQNGYAGLIRDGVLADLDSKLTPATRAIGVAFRSVMENQLVSIGAYERWIDHYPKFLHVILKEVPYPVRVVLIRIMYPPIKKTIMSGVGRYGPEMFTTLLPEGINALATQLGSNT